MEKKRSKPVRAMLSLMLGGLPACLSANPMYFDAGNFASHCPSPGGCLIPSNGHLAKHMVQYRIDFGQVLQNQPDHLTHHTFRQPLTGATVKFEDIKHYQNGSIGRCWEYVFYVDDGKDWILWANTGTNLNPVWTKLSDDAIGYSPQARVWVQGSVTDITTRLRISPYHTDSQIAGWAMVADLGSVTQATCENTSFAVLKLINSTASIKTGP